MEPTTIVLFGATGDLAKRKIYPALYNLFLDRKLPSDFTLVGLGRREVPVDVFRANVERSLREFSRREGSNSAAVSQFVQSFYYQVLDVGHSEDYDRLLRFVKEREAGYGAVANRLFYLSVGPEFFGPIAENIKASGLGSDCGWKRLVIEKPFGYDLASARALNAKLSESFAEDEIYRIDHYLGKPMVQKLEVLQQNNPVLQALWTNRYIANVQITASETVGVEQRAAYYDQSGAIRDMFQNHMLQLLMMLTSQLPTNSSAEQVRFKKRKVMEALEPLHRQQVGTQIIRGQYAEGNLKGQPVAGYTEEPGIAATSMNDTYIAAKLQIDDYFWRGVPFYIRTGKRLQEKATRIVIEFKEPLQQSAKHPLVPKTPNLLIFDIGPDEGITLQLNARDPKDKGAIKPIHINFHEQTEDMPEAYESLIRDAIAGDPTFFAHWDEVELSWQWVQPILEAFAANEVPLHRYEAGTWGPAAADELLAADGFRWWQDEQQEQLAPAAAAAQLA
ncbi:glucose-6-phosphate dehydrogenase [Paenibacillus sp. 1P07SE]|uniref:glucose-6-phosphate dehydrogenase n=1 Tax=Paenibacillus sp. 1P07SE TaxID=3132209 RepID=UPI0039A50660